MKHAFYFVITVAVAMIAALTGCSERRNVGDHAMAGIDSLANGLYAQIYTSPAESAEGLTRLRDSVAANDSDIYYALTPHIALASLVSGDREASDSLMAATGRYIAAHPDAMIPLERFTTITGVIHSLYGRNRESVDDFLLVSQYARTNRNWQLAVKSLANAGEMLELAGNPAEGVVLLRSAMVLSDSTGASELDFSIRTRAAGIYNILGNYTESDRFYQMNAARIDQVPPVDRFYYYSSLGNSYYYRDLYQLALDNFLKAKAELPAIGDPYLVPVTNSNVGECYMYLNSLDSARYYIDLAVKDFDDLAVNDVNQVFYLNSLRGELEMRSGNHALARKLLLAADPDKVSLAPRYVALHHKRLQELYSADGNYGEALYHMNKADEIEDSIIHFLTRNYTAEVNARHRQDTTILHTRLRMVEKEEEISRLYLWVTIIVAVAVLVTLGLGIHSLVRRRRNQRQLDNLRTIMLKMRLENARNRISPHFVFNILNAELPADNVNIRNLVSLMRLNLELCNRQLITLGEELDFIRTYIQVMAPSIGDGFVYEEHIDPAINPEEVKIPAMMIQIVVENAVKHGLMGYDYPGKRLTLDLHRVDGGALLTIDNTLPANAHAQARGTGTGLRIVNQAISAFNQRNTASLTHTDEIIPVDDTISIFRVSIFVPAGYDFDLREHDE